MEQKKNPAGTAYPGNLYLVESADGGYEWYDCDPRGAEGRDRHRIESIESFITGWFGDSDLGNPIMVRLECEALDRCTPFDAAMPHRVRCGELAKHFEDLEGSVIEVTEQTGDDPDWPFVGAVLKDGTVLETRTYSLRGACSDGDEGHRLVAVDGILEI